MAAIFISHSSRDNLFAEQMKAWLNAQGYEQVFLDFDKDTGLQAGKSWESELYEKIERCHAVILILTPNWLDSKWCFVEFAQARALGKIIFPVVLTPLGDRHVAPEIQGVDLKDWNTDGQNYLSRRIREVSDEIARGFPWDRARSPYPGIHSFDAEDAAIFFGRDIEIRDVIERLEARRVQGGKRLLLILGASGSGKSSLLKAGVLPQLTRDRSHWITLPPFRPERLPLTHLAKVIAEASGDMQSWRAWQQRLARDPERALHDVADCLRLGESRNATALIAVDQFEEIFTLADADERDAFLALINRLSENRSELRFQVLATLRSDVLGELLQSQQFPLAFDNYALRPMPLDSLPKIIEGPAAVAALTLEKGLSQRVCEDVRTPDALPLLAFALREFYERYGKDRRLTLADYIKLGDSALGLSPIENAVRRRADDVLVMLSPSPEELAGLKAAFVPHLVRIRDGDTFVRQSARLDLLPATARRLIGAFVDARLLVRHTDPAADGQDVLVEVSHEALFKAWPMLAGWLNEERSFLAGKAQLGQWLEDWRTAPADQKTAALLRGRNLSRSRQWLQTHRPGFTNEEITFIQTSSRRALARNVAVSSLVSIALFVLVLTGAQWGYGEYVRHTALDCDLLAAEVDNNVSVPGVEFDRINTQVALPACQEAVKRDPENPRLIHNLARSLDAAGRLEDAAYWYRRAVDRNWAWSKNNLGAAYLAGRGVPIDFSRGIELLRAAAEQNNPPAIVTYREQDYVSLFNDNEERTVIIQKALVEKGLLAPANATGVWDSQTDTSLQAFKRSANLPDKGVTLRVLDKLDVVGHISKQIQNSRRESP